VIRIGTTSWGEESLVRSGRFYPEDARTPEARLRFFAQRFPITEVDTSFYAIPDPDVVERWAQWTPAEFVFDMKAFRLFTGHRTPMKMLPPEVRPALEALGKDNLYYADVRDACSDVLDELWSRFRASIDPLARAGKLGVVLLQLAPWYVRRTDALQHIEECVDRLSGHRVALEVRNKSWFSPHGAAQALAFERDLGLAHVVVDEPQGFASSVPRVWAVTSPEVAVVRLHGRNRAMWHGNQARSAAERFDYLYSDEELAAFVDPVLDLARRARDVHVLFNNCHDDNAQRNADTFTRLVAERQAQAIAPEAPSASL
jgi:uncharacterized protein YecE (DUF72 family)